MHSDRRTHCFAKHNQMTYFYPGMVCVRYKSYLSAYCQEMSKSEWKFPLKEAARRWNAIRSHKHGACELGSLEREMTVNGRQGKEHLLPDWLQSSCAVVPVADLYLPTLEAKHKKRQTRPQTSRYSWFYACQLCPIKSARQFTGQYHIRFYSYGILLRADVFFGFVYIVGKEFLSYEFAYVMWLHLDVIYAFWVIFLLVLSLFND